MKRSSFAKVILLAVPLLLGVSGLMGAGETFPNALFYGVCMYAMNYQEVPPNLLVEAARWLAPLATASGVLLAVTVLRQRVRARWRYWRGDSVAVYGPEGEKEALLAQLGRRGLDGGEHIVRAHRYILLGDDSFDFYLQNRRKLENKAVYLKYSVLPAQAVSSPSLRLFCPEEIAARLFWKEQNLYERSAARSHRLNIVFLGFGCLGENLLTYGLLDNIFAPDQRIAYHIFGADGRFAATHPQLGAIGDPVVFYGEPWYTQLPLLEEADMVLVLEQNDPLALLQSLLLATIRPSFYVFAADSAGLDLLEGQKRLTVIPWLEQAQTPEYIFSDSLYRRAKRINLRYAHIYSGAEENEENMQAEWEKLDSFTRYSNISAADYHEMRLAMLASMGAAAADATADPALLERLSELEHIRWCRYHYLNNWRRGTPENGKRKDAAQRIHADLVAYAELTDAEKEKDRENIRVLMAID